MTIDTRRLSDNVYFLTDLSLWLINYRTRVTPGDFAMAMDVTLRQLRAYVAVLESSSFSEAARAMHLSQAALSGLIKELENRLGVRLLDRTTRKVAPSAVGEAFEPMARRARPVRWRRGYPRPACSRR